MRRILSFGTAAALAALAWSTCAAAQAGPVPDFSGYWVRIASPGGGRTLDPPANGGPGPIMDPADHRGAAVIWVGDTSNPILKPHARAAIEARNEFVRGGGIELPAWSLCWPTGIPQVLNLGEGVQFLQTAERITVLYQRDAQVRRFDVNASHLENPERSWYGHSIAHYEGSDTIVVDTNAMDRRAVVDRFATPRSEEMRIVERYILAPDGQAMTVEFTVEDPETFNMAWSGQVRYRRINAPIQEDICAENNKDASTGKDYPIPIASRADF